MASHLAPAPWSVIHHPDGTASVMDANGERVAIVVNGNADVFRFVPELVSIVLQARDVANGIEGGE